METIQCQKCKKSFEMKSVCNGCYQGSKFICNECYPRDMTLKTCVACTYDVCVDCSCKFKCYIECGKFKSYRVCAWQGCVENWFETMKKTDLVPVKVFDYLNQKTDKNGKWIPVPK